MSDVDTPGFFELAESIWADADDRRDGLQQQHGEELGNFLADIRQYGSAWVGDVWEWTAIGAERHPAFATVPPVHPWDTENYGFVMSNAGTRPSYSSGWGGWRKPHKERTNQGIGVEIARDGDRVTMVFMPEGYL